MAGVSGFVIAMAEYRVQQQRHKRLFGGPFVTYGQCLSMAGYFFELGGVLGARYRDRPDEFGPVFIGLRGEAGAMLRYYSELVEKILPHVTQASTIPDYVARSEAERLNFAGEPWELMLQRGADKVQPGSAVATCWGSAGRGAALGALRPADFKRLFEGTHQKADEASWQDARAAGLDIPEQQDVMTYDEVEQGEVESFLAYCQEFAPVLYSSLSSV